MSEHITITRVYDAANEFSNAMNAANDKSVTRDVMASFYADCVMARITGEQIVQLNKAIMSRWPKGLVYIKTKAWQEVKTGKPAFIKH